MDKNTPFLLFLFLFLLFGTYACKPDKDSEPKKTLITGCGVSLQFEAETTTFIRPHDASQTSQLSILDSALMMPQRERTIESVCIKPNGDYRIEKTFATPDDPIGYPVRAINLFPKATYKRMVNNNGSITFLNELDEVIDSDIVGNISSMADEVLTLFQELKEAPPLTDADFTNALNILSNNGLSLLAHDENILTTRVDHPGGAFSIMVIDKNIRMKVGQMDFDQEGHPCTAYFVDAIGQAPNVVFQKMIQNTWFKAIDSGVRMKMTKMTDFKSFNLDF